MWWIRSTKGFFFASSPFLSSLSSPRFLFIVNSQTSSIYFSGPLFYFALPLFILWKPKQIDRAKHKYSANSLQRAFLRRQQAVDLYFLLHSMGMQQIRPAVPWRVLAQWNHFVRWCSGPAPNFLSPKLPYAVCWRPQLAEGCSVPLPPTPAPGIFSAVWATCGEEIFFLLLLAPVYQYQKTQGSLCPLPCLVVGSQCCIIQNTYSAFLAGLSDPLFTLTFASSSWGRNSKFSPVHSSSFSSIPKHFSWNFHLCEPATALQLL